MFTSIFIIICVKSDIVDTPSQILVMIIYRGNMPWLFAVGICHNYLVWLFTVGICLGDLPQLFAVRIYRGYLPWVCFVYVKKPFFLRTQIFILLTLFRMGFFGAAHGLQKGLPSLKSVTHILQ